MVYLAKIIFFMQSLFGYMAKKYWFHLAKVPLLCKVTLNKSVYYIHEKVAEKKTTSVAIDNWWLQVDSKEKIFLLS